MKIRISGWITPEGYAGTVLKDEVPSRALRVELEVEVDAEKDLEGLRVVPSGRPYQGYPAFEVQPIWRARR